MNKFSENRNLNYKYFIKSIWHKKFALVQSSIATALFFLAIFFLIKPEYSTNSVLFPYKQSSGISNLLQSSLPVSFSSQNQSDDLTRIYVELFESSDFLISTFNEKILNKDGKKVSIYDIKYTDELSKYNDRQIDVIIHKSIVDNNMKVSFDSYTGLFFIELSFHDPIFALNYHNKLIHLFDLYLSDLKNAKLLLKNNSFINKQMSILNDLEKLEISKKNFLENNRAVLQSPSLSNELYSLEREIRLKESSYVGITNSIEMNNVDISLVGNNFRIIDEPFEPLKPNLSMLIMIFCGFVLGLFLPIAYHISKELT